MPSLPPPPLPAGDRPHVSVPATVNEMLLRGTQLRNSGRIVGLVVYTGPETRIQKNSAKPPLKHGEQQQPCS